MTSDLESNHQQAATPEPRWRPGDLVVLRYLTLGECRPGLSWPCRVVADRDDLVALYIANGTPFKNWQVVDGEPRHVDAVWRNDVLRLMFPNRGHSIWLFWEPGAERRFHCYYVNMEEPFRRTAIGFDTKDHQLDVVITPEFSWWWKDENHLVDRVRRGAYSAELAAEIRAEGERVIAALESRGSPFCDGWERWTPDPSWTIPSLPPNWETEPAARWHRSEWAYPSPR